MTTILSFGDWYKLTDNERDALASEGINLLRENSSLRVVTHTSPTLGLYFFIAINNLENRFFKFIKKLNAPSYLCDYTNRK